MTSQFTKRAGKTGAPLGIRFNGESITLRTASDSVSVKAIVDIPETTSQQEGPVEVFGRFSVLTTIYASKVAPLGLIATATIKGLSWHVYERGSDEAGLTTFQIRRTFTEAEYSNTFDINDQQATWGN